MFELFSQLFEKQEVNQRYELSQKIRPWKLEI